MKSIKAAHIPNAMLNMLSIIAGTFLLAAGIYCFAEPCNIAPGGVSGIAILVNHVTNTPVGLTSLLLNIPLLIFATRFMGKKFVLSTLWTLLILTLMLDATMPLLLPQYLGDRMLGSLTGGVLMGAGLGVVFRRGTSTGGTDILSYYVQHKRPHIPIGKALMLIDIVILGASMLVYGAIEAGLYGLVALLAQAKVIDAIVYGGERGSVVTLVTSRGSAIAGKIISRLGRSATLLSGRGAYSTREQDVLICAVLMPQFTELKRIVQSEDPSAFMVVSEAAQILGEGFLPLDKDGQHN